METPYSHIEVRNCENENNQTFADVMGAPYNGVRGPAIILLSILSAGKGTINLVLLEKRYRRPSRIFYFSPFLPIKRKILPGVNEGFFFSNFFFYFFFLFYFN